MTIILLLILIAVTPLWGGDYDLGRSQALIAVGEALAAPDGDSRLAQSLQALPDGAAAQELRMLIQDRELRKELFRQAAQLLQEGRFHDLNDLLDRAESRGESNTALLQLRGIPQALQALSLFCARQPYQNSGDLAQSMDFLQPYVAELSRYSASFREYYRKQQQLLIALRGKEAESAFARELKQLDWSLVTAPPPMPPAAQLRSLRQRYPQAPFFRYVTDQSAPAPPLIAALENPDAAASQPQWLEIALALTWGELSSAEQKLATSYLLRGPAVTLTGQAMRAGLMGSLPEFQRALAAWRQQATPEERREKAPAFLPAYLGLLGVTGDEWRNPAPGIPELLQRCRQN